MKKTVLAFSRITPAMAERLQQDFNVILPNPKLGDINAQFNEALPEAHGLIGVGRKLGRAQLEGAAKLEVVSSVSVGYDNYDLDYFNERGIALTNTPDVLTESTADLGFSLIMGCARRTAELDAWTKAGHWQAIVGLGNIGAAIARRGRFGFNMQVLYAGNSRKPALEQELGAQYRSLEQLLGEADFVCIVVPLSDATRKLIGARELKLMKPSAFLINIARGPVVDEAALVEALQNGTIRGAGLDVYEKEPLSESPLFALPNALTLPHIGSATAETREAMANRAMDNLRAALLGERPRDLVNPQVWKG
ncbi:2-hydroxyacid dehydrogenase [Pseudomonas plecoglossicida]|uniref:D-glycerate dehydrogenase n=1 Tax=Pseudomonas plecoglossicida TaxID=70775 RepID=A0AAD0VTI9_PSEDL|nr:D-glycerate dehydrogenase [Pseudomonas plecoglossicida]AXM96403.1 D-glycerate dehydrogenase [Pseudomonas plecoglossicida]EPB93164.1 D-isomer specific 2-hydroxyacid dehydrogenase [Pseudomonas plecoglossicida NB2011]QLB57154.1 D-glycerate dehydrogenase [Pseudomonas plecoglossicida]